jgi:hypothetical protein
MKRTMAAAVGLAMLCAFAATWAQTKPDAAPGGQTLVVKVKYKGKGTVDDQHKIYVMVLDSDPYSSDVLADATSTKPIDPNQARGKKIAYILQRQGTSSKEQPLTFTGLSRSPVYVIAFFDQAGSYEKTQGPAPGSPSGQVGNTPFKPDPIKLKEGKPTEVKLPFDDSSKTP